MSEKTINRSLRKKYNLNYLAVYSNAYTLLECINIMR